ncbi:response regulator [Devosia sp.]|uniref:response regulator n=1 Tax=Devosia sp. TaxID=1871048 RepID=UPI003263F460
MTDKPLKTAVNLTKVSFLVAEPNDLYRGLFRGLLFGFGAAKVHEALDPEAADRMLARHKIDVLICAVDLPGKGGIDYVRNIRLNPDHPNRSMPILITMGTARRISVGMARDSGANFVLSKPISPLVLYDRLNWIARNPRPFWEDARYFGPDRRFRALRHEGLPQRRAADTEAQTMELDD